jgi:hypothetical protein
MRVLCLSALLCSLLSGPALAQQQLPDCSAKKEFGEWAVTAWPTMGVVVFPRNDVWPRNRDDFGDSARMPVGSADRELTVEHRRPQGTVRNLPAKGVATARFDSFSEKLDLTGTFSFESYAASPGYPAKGNAAVDDISFSFPLKAQASGLIEFLKLAEQRNKDVSMSVLAKGQTFVRYAFKASGFQEAYRWVGVGQREVAELLRAKKCEEPCLFGLC